MFFIAAMIGLPFIMYVMTFKKDFEDNDVAKVVAALAVISLIFIVFSFI